MPGLITTSMPDPPVTKAEKKIARKIAVCILVIGALFIAVPTAAAGPFNSVDPTREVPNPGWIVDY